MSTEAYIEMVYRNLKGELSPDEFKKLNDITGKDNELATLRLEIEDAWDVSGAEEVIVKKKDTELLYQRIIQEKKRDGTRFTKLLKFSKPVISGIAAFFVIGLSALWLLRDQTEVYSEKGLIQLADNSMIELREGSRLEVTSINENARNVTLIGEAFFDIEEDASRPFIISTANTKVEVLGTSFLVKESNNAVFVVVEEGRVRFSNNKTEESVELTAGMKAVADDEGEIREVQYQNLMGWKNGIYEYEDQELADIIEELNVIFNTTIVVENQQLLNCRISAILPEENLKDILNQLASRLEMNAKQNGQDWILSQGKCK